MKHIRKDKNFISMFDDKTGFYMRTGIIRNGKDTGEDPFMASFPELLDVGIMGHCAHGKSGLCLQAGVQCYQDGLHSKAKNMTVDDFAEIVRQCRKKTYQIALGGCGDPDMHEDFERILKMCRKNGIIPNFTTSGLGMTKEKAAACKKYCGAVAVSWYRSVYTERAIEMLTNAGVKTNIHYVLSKSTIEEAIWRLTKNNFPSVNAVVFLLHKPIGQGTIDEVLHLDDPNVRRFFETVKNKTFSHKIGFDSCTVPALVQSPGNIDLASLDTCEGARWSAYITPDMRMLPCSFDNQDQRWAVDLKEHTIQEAWSSDVFNRFRSHFQQSCPECSHRALCMGGCPICPDIVLCRKK